MIVSYASFFSGAQEGVPLILIDLILISAMADMWDRWGWEKVTYWVLMTQGELLRPTILLLYYIDPVWT